MGLGKRAFAAFWVVASLAMPTCAIAEISPRAVLIVDESDSNSPFGDRFREQVHSTLDAESTQHYVIYPESLDFGHFSGPEYDATLHAFFKNKYKDKLISVIVALGSDALKFVSNLRAEMWPSAPIVFVIFNDAIANVPSNATGAIVLQRFQNLVTSAQHLVPDLARIALVGGSLDREPLRRHYQSEMQQLPENLSVIDLTGLPLAEVKKRIATLPGNAAIAYTPIYSDETGNNHNPGEVLAALAEVANRPIVVDQEAFIGRGATGGIVLSAEELGRETGRKLARILKGESAANIPIASGQFTKPIFDARQLKRWGISDLTLPRGSDLQFRELNAWDLYRWQIVAVALVIPVQSLVIMLLYYERRRRHLAEREAHQHLLEVTKMDRAMTASAMSASIAHELNQPLSAILNNAETAEMLLTAKPLDREQLKEILADIRRDDYRAVDIIKHLRMLLKQGELDAKNINLTELLSDTIGLFKPRAAEQGVTVEIALVPTNLQVRADRVHIQQVLLNLAMNAIDAMQNVPVGKRKLKLKVTRRDNEAVIAIEDTGTGIPEDKLKSIFEPFVTTKQQGTGLGLSIARTIIHTYGGRIWAENRAGNGAMFCFTLSLAKAEAAQATLEV
jgi:signal transduction histidine kinase